jgi:hypothetical protein
MNLGDVSFHPRIGAEFNYHSVLAFRAGLNRVAYSSDNGFDLTPSVGTGIRLSQVSLDYGFGDFAGLVSELGFSHRISLTLSLEQPGLKRPGTE